MAWRFSRSKRTMELHSQHTGTAIQRNWSSCLQKHQCCESWDLEAKERQLYHSLQWRFYEYRTLAPNSSLCQSAQWKLRIGVINSPKRRRKRTSQCYCGQSDSDDGGTRRRRSGILVSPPTQAPCNRMQGGALSFQTLGNKIQLTHLRKRFELRSADR